MKFKNGDRVRFFDVGIVPFNGMVVMVKKATVAVLCDGVVVVVDKHQVRRV